MAAVDGDNATHPRQLLTSKVPDEQDRNQPLDGSEAAAKHPVVAVNAPPPAAGTTAIANSCAGQPELAANDGLSSPLGYETAPFPSAQYLLWALAGLQPPQLRVSQQAPAALQALMQRSTRQAQAAAYRSSLTVPLLQSLVEDALQPPATTAPEDHEGLDNLAGNQSDSELALVQRFEAWCAKQLNKEAELRDAALEACSSGQWDTTAGTARLTALPLLLALMAHVPQWSDSDIASSALHDTTSMLVSAQHLPVEVAACCAGLLIAQLAEHAPRESALSAALFSALTQVVIAGGQCMFCKQIRQQGALAKVIAAYLEVDGPVRHQAAKLLAAVLRASPSQLAEAKSSLLSANASYRVEPAVAITHVAVIRKDESLCSLVKVLVQPPLSIVPSLVAGAEYTRAQGNGVLHEPGAGSRTSIASPTSRDNAFWECICRLAKFTEAWPAFRQAKVFEWVVHNLESTPSMASRAYLEAISCTECQMRDPALYEPELPARLGKLLPKLFALLKREPSATRDAAIAALSHALDSKPQLHDILLFHVGIGGLLTAWGDVPESWRFRCLIARVLGSLVNPSTLNMLHMSFLGNDLPSLKQTQWPMLGTILADVRAEPDRLDLVALSNVAGIANAVAGKGADARAAMRACRAHRHLAVILLHTLAKLHFPRDRLSAFDSGVGSILNSLAASLAVLMKQADFDNTTPEVAAAGTAVAEALLGSANSPPPEPADAADGVGNQHYASSPWMADTSDDSGLARIMQTSGIIHLVDRFFQLSPASTRRFRVHSCIYDLVALATKAMSLTSQATNSSPPAGWACARVAFYSGMGVTSYLLVAADKREAASLLQLPAGQAFGVVHGAFLIAWDEMNQSIGSDSWYRWIKSGCKYVGVHLLSARPATPGWLDCMASLCDLLASLLTSGSRLLASFQANPPEDAWEGSKGLRFMLDYIATTILTIVAKAGIDACRGCLAPVARALTGLDSRTRDRLLAKGVAAKLQALAKQQPDEQAEAAAQAAAEALLAEEDSLSRKAEAAKAKRKKKAKAKKGKSVALAVEAASSVENEQPPNGWAAVGDEAVNVQPDSKGASCEAAKPSPVEKAASLTSAVPAQHADHAEPAQPPGGTSRQRPAQLNSHRQPAETYPTTFDARDKAAVPNSRATEAALQEAAGHSRRPAEVAVQRAKSADASMHPQPLHPCVPPPGVVAAARPSSAQGPALPAVPPVQSAVSSIGQGWQQCVHPTGAEPGTNMFAMTASGASGRGSAAVTAGQHDTGAAVAPPCEQETSSELAALMQQLSCGAMPSASSQASQPRGQHRQTSSYAASLLHQQPGTATSYRSVQHWDSQGMQVPLPGAFAAGALRPRPVRHAMQLHADASSLAGQHVPGLVAAPAVPPPAHSPHAARTGSPLGQHAPLKGQASMQAAVVHMAEMECPITQDIMHDPVIAVDGHTYERAAIEEWFGNHDTSPMTNECLPDKQLISNVLVYRLIQSYQGGNLSIHQA